MTDDQDAAVSLASIGLPYDSRALNVLGVILRLAEETSQPATSTQIHEAIITEQTDTEITKTWVHRVIKSLLETHLIRSDSEKAYRKRYMTDIGTIVVGLEHLKSQAIIKASEEQKDIAERIRKIESIDTELIGEKMIESITGVKQRLNSRFIRGLDEFHRVTNYSIYQIAKKGDVIRNCMLWVEPFLTEDLPQRIQRLMEAAEKGVEVRYFVTEEFTSAEPSILQTLSPEAIRHFVATFLDLAKSGKKIEFRLYRGPKNTYQFASLNQDRIAFFLTYDPLTAVYFTQDFNPDLIRNCVSTFDEYWEDAPLFFEWIASHSKDERGGDFARIIASVMEK